MIFDQTPCELGEGPLWHPLRQSLFWFDINNKRMFERGLSDHDATLYVFDEYVSAAGWVDHNTLLIASETALFYFDLTRRDRQTLVELESDNALTRSNDGRADPWGGFWIGTMGKNAEPQAGTIYRYYQGILKPLFSHITISNSICFAPTGNLAYFCDTPSKKIMKVTLDSNGWPIESPSLFTDVSPCAPDGSVVDTNGNFWNAQWGAYRVACYSPRGGFLHEILFDAKQVSCPAFGGADMSTLFVTSARESLAHPCAADGQTYHTVPAIPHQTIKGQIEHQVKR